MKFTLPLLLLLLTACSSNTYKVVDALKPGMTPDEARTAIQSYGFTQATSLTRPADGWPKAPESFVSPGWKAGQMETRIGKQVHRVEYYPLAEGAVQLFLFYSEEGRLLTYHRQ